MELKPLKSFSKEDDINEFGLDKEFEKVGINFVAIDLETATKQRNSICEIGLAIVENGEVKETKSWLVRPPENKYYAFNIFIHGIKPEDTENSPQFQDVWKEVLPYIRNKVLVAHYSAFDMYALKDAFLSFEMEMPSLANFCSYLLSKKTVNGLYSYTLDSVCSALNVDLKTHHRAESDAEACARIFLKCLEISKATSFADLQEKYNFRCGRFSENFFRPQRSIRDYSNKKKLDPSSIVGDPSKVDEDNYFYDKVVCFTGKCMYAIRKDLLQMVADIGGHPADSVNAKTDVLVIGQQDYRVVGESGMSSKQKKAMAMRDKGMDIEILSETDFLSMIGI